ncbi:hypothetical protein [Scytonema sp. HK-05]|nr:hypothetical protein [Scytonema sp. HK-05]
MPPPLILARTLKISPATTPAKNLQPMRRDRQAPAVEDSFSCT